MKPTPGRIVLYKLSERDAKMINDRNADAERNRQYMNEQRIGFVAHIGNHAAAGDVLPMMIVRVWGGGPGTDAGTVNGQVFVDGNHTLWVTSRSQGSDPECWDWPSPTS